MSSQTASSRSAQATWPAVDSVPGRLAQGSATMPMHRSCWSGPPRADLMQDCTAAESRAFGFSGLALSAQPAVTTSIDASQASQTALATVIGMMVSRPTLLVVPFGCVRRIDHATVRLLELADFGHFRVAQLEIEDREVGGEMVGIGGARDRHDALLDQIAQRHLRGALAVVLADALEHRVARHLAAGDRAIGGRRDAVLTTGGEHLALIEERMDLDLVRRQRLARELDRLRKQRGGEVGDADMLGTPVPFGFAKHRERVCQRHLRIGPVDQQEIDPRQLELLQALVERALEVGGRQLVLIDLVVRKTSSRASPAARTPCASPSPTSASLP